jgi:putative transposase
MPRKPRFYLPGIPAHVVQRGNCRQAVFFEDSDYLAYRNWLAEGASKHGCAIHAYVLMTNHVHLLITPAGPESISRTLQYVGRHYVPYVNQPHGRSGTLWEGRHKGCIIDSERYLFICMQYIELNPVRAGMAAMPAEYRWSSHAANADGSPDRLVTPHALYHGLGRTPGECRMRYRELFEAVPEPDQVQDIRATVQTGTPLGNERFHRQVEQALGCRVGQSRRGRPMQGQRKGY